MNKRNEDISGIIPALPARARLVPKQGEVARSEQEPPATGSAEPPPPSFHLDAPLTSNSGFSLLKR